MVKIDFFINFVSSIFTFLAIENSNIQELSSNMFYPKWIFGQKLDFLNSVTSPSSSKSTLFEAFAFASWVRLWNEKLPLKCSSSEEVAYALYWRADFPVHLRPLHTRPWGPKRGFYRRLGTTYQYAGIKRCWDGGVGRSTFWRKWLRSTSKCWIEVLCRLFVCPKRNTCLQGLSRSWKKK